MEKGITVWMTGKPNSGKTTMANILTENLIKRGQQVEVFDGEDKNLRTRHLGTGPNWDFPGKPA